MFENCGGCCFSLILIPLLCCVLVVGVVIYIYVNAPDAPISGKFKASAAEARAFDDAINRAVADAQRSGGFSLTFTERQISSWMVQEGTSYAEQHGHVFPFDNVQVGLDDGNMTFYGEINYLQLDLPLEVIFTPGVSSTGQLDLAISEASLGGIALPDVVLQDVTDQLEDALTASLDDLPGEYVLDPNSLSVQNGSFVVRGQIRY